LKKKRLYYTSLTFFPILACISLKKKKKKKKRKLKLSVRKYNIDKLKYTQISYQLRLRHDCHDVICTYSVHMWNDQNISTPTYLTNKAIHSIIYYRVIPFHILEDASHDRASAPQRSARFPSLFDYADHGHNYLSTQAA